MTQLTIADLFSGDQTSENTSLSISEEVFVITVEDLEDDDDPNT